MTSLRDTERAVSELAEELRVPLPAAATRCEVAAMATARRRGAPRKATEK